MPRLLDRLTAQNSSGIPLVNNWNRMCEKIETALGGIDDQLAAITALQTAQATLISDLADAVADIAAAQAAADAAAADAATAQSTATTAQTTATSAATTASSASTAASTAQTTANTVKRDDKIGTSSVIPANVLTATDAGSNATITIAAHTRLYNDNSTLSVAGGSLTGLSYSTAYGVYYDDTTTADTTPTYHSTTTLSNALNNFVAGRHFVGNVTTPASGGAPATGGVSPPGTGTSDRGSYSSV